VSRQARSRRWLTTVLVAVAVLLVGLLLTIMSRSWTGPQRSEPAEAATSDAPAPVRPTVPTGSAGPVPEPAGVPVGFSGDEPGAVAAAIAYATASQRWLYFTDEQIRAAIDEIATPAAAPRIADGVITQVSLARDQLGASPGRVWWLVRPLAWAVQHFDPDRARVAVWVVTVLSAAEVAAPQTEWMTVTLDLTWMDGDWRVEAVRDSPGPTPMTGPRDQPWDAVPFDEALDGFTRLDGEPVR
jgi:hypothetical protein